MFVYSRHKYHVPNVQHMIYDYHSLCLCLVIKACVRVGSDVSEWFPVNVGLRRGCVMSPWLFNVYMDRVVREVYMDGVEQC